MTYIFCTKDARNYVQMEIDEALPIEEIRKLQCRAFIDRLVPDYLKPYIPAVSEDAGT